jgi:hypothetical protein
MVLLYFRGVPRSGACGGGAPRDDAGEADADADEEDDDE